MVKTNIVATPTIELSSDGCGLEAKRLLRELEIIMYALDIEMVEMVLEKRNFWKSKQSIESLYGTKFEKRRKITRANKKMFLKVGKEEERERISRAERKDFKYNQRSNIY